MTSLNEDKIQILRGKLNEFASTTSQNDEELAEHLAEEFIKDHGRQTLREKFDRSHRRIQYRRYILFALLAIVLALSIFWVVNQTSENTSIEESNFAEYIQPYPNVFTFRGQDATTNSELLTSAMQAYDEGNYNSAIRYFKDYVDQEDGTSNDLAVFYYSQCLIQTGDFDRAISLLSRLSEKASSSLHPDVLWYLSLAQLQKTNQSNAKTTLQFLSNSYPDYKIIQVETILDSLGR